MLEVLKYRERGTRGSAFKGKFYVRRPQHGRVIEAIVPASQEHVVAKGNIWGTRSATVASSTNSWTDMGAGSAGSVPSSSARSGAGSADP